MIVLADTSVWLDHWRRGNPRFAEFLGQRRVLLHPFVLGEISLGAISDRANVLLHLRKLRAPRVARHEEVLALIERTPLWRRGIGWVDAHLVASALLDRLRIWTLDRRLRALAQDLNLSL